MVNYCNVYGCTNRSDREKDRSFFRLPAVINNQGDECRELSLERRRKWLANLHQDFGGKNTANIRICSDHFIKGKPSYLHNRTDPDWTPTVNMGHEKMKKSDPDCSIKRHERSKNREVKKQESLAAESLLLEQMGAQESDNNSDLDQLQLDAQSQTNISGKLLEEMNADMQSLRLENIELKQKLSFSKLTLENLEGQHSKVKFLTGLTTYETLATFYKFVEPHLSPKKSMSPFQMLLMSLMRLRLNLAEQFLAYEFCVSQSTISRIFTDVVDTLFNRTKSFVYWPEREVLRKTMPMDFRKHFSDKVAVIIDCFECFIERPSNLEARAQTWSNYKHHNTVKFLMGVTPQGLISFISKGWGGRVSDKYLTEHSGFLNKIIPGDVILADRGFDIQDLVGSMCAEAKIPAFTRGKDQLSPLEVELTRKIAHCRIHVERVIGTVRQKYTILGSTLPIDFLQTADENNFTFIDKVVHLCCALTNICPPIVCFE